ncbi:hypothetical protein ACWDYK_27195, partial [Streptomyces anthocyanicus]
MADRPGPGPGAGPGPLPGLEESLADLAESGRRHAAPPAPERIRARGEQRRGQQRAAGRQCGPPAAQALLAARP